MKPWADERGSITAGLRTPAGDLWIALARRGDEALLHRPPGADWTRVQLPELTGDSTRWSYADPGWIEIVVGADAPRVEISAERCTLATGAPGWRFAVRDNGAGIEPRHHDRVWQIFQTLQPRDQIEGTGIGLSLVRKIVEQHGGAVALDSAPGEGATFSFTWPTKIDD